VNASMQLKYHSRYKPRKNEKDELCQMELVSRWFPSCSERFTQLEFVVSES